MHILTLDEIKQLAEEFILDHNPTDDALKHHCTEMMKYLEQRGALVAFHEELMDIIENVEDLDDRRIRNWCLKAKYLFDELFIPFALFYLDHKFNTDELIYLNVDSYFVKRQDIIHLYVFAKLNWVLYFGEYYKAPDDRAKPDPNIDETKGYYYSPPDPNAPTELEEVKALLALL